MEKIETLLKIETDNYATPKKLNRSDRQIPQHVLDQIRSGNVTCEMLDQVSATVPVFKYKTCITLHGHFNLGPVMPRIGGYANILKNQNGSLEVRYNAIDLAKKQRIAQVLRDCKADFRFSIDSQGTEFYSQTQVRDVPEYLAVAASGTGHLSFKYANSQVEFTVDGYEYDFRCIIMPLS